MLDTTLPLPAFDPIIPTLDDQMWTELKSALDVAMRDEAMQRRGLNRLLEKDKAALEPHPYMFISVNSIRAALCAKGFDFKTPKTTAYMAAMCAPNGLKLNKDGKQEPAIYINIDFLVANQPEIVSETIRHELVHADQMTRGDLRQTSEGWYWRGKLYSHDWIHSMSGEFETAMERILWEVTNLPWEREAYDHIDWIREQYRYNEHFEKLCELLGYEQHYAEERSKDPYDDRNMLEMAVKYRSNNNLYINFLSGRVDATWNHDEWYSQENYNPSQPVICDEDGVIRFKPNQIIKDLFDAGKLDLNSFAGRYSDDDRSQLSQLIGYSHDSWSGLSTVDSRAYWGGVVEKELFRYGRGSSLSNDIEDYYPQRIRYPGIEQNAREFTPEKQLNIPVGLPVLIDRIFRNDGAYVFKLKAGEYNVEWVERGESYGRVSYDLTDKPVSHYCHETAIHFTTSGVELSNLDGSNNYKLINIDWDEVARFVVPTNEWRTYTFQLTRLLTMYGNRLADDSKAVELDLLYNICRIIIVWMQHRKYILTNMNKDTFGQDKYSKVYKAVKKDGIANNELITSIAASKTITGSGIPIKHRLSTMLNSGVVFNDGVISLKKDGYVYEADVEVLADLIK